MYSILEAGISGLSAGYHLSIQRNNLKETDQEHKPKWILSFFVVASNIEK